jgi:hypothetical protein
MEGDTGLFICGELDEAPRQLPQLARMTIQPSLRPAIICPFAAMTLQVLELSFVCTL